MEAWKPIYDNYRRLLGGELFNVLHKNWQDDKANEIRDHCKKYPEWMQVAEEDEDIVGFITYYIDERAR